MNLYENAISFTASFMVLVLIVLFLRYRGIILKSDAPLIAKLTVDFVLPALLISKLIFVKFSVQILVTCSYIVFSEFIIGIILKTVNNETFPLVVSNDMPISELKNKVKVASYGFV